jgi:hypothetical protein
MDFRVENLGILFGLFALAAPILLHLIRRHRYDTLDWGAMQFLPDNFTTQRKRWLDEILLMLMRMAMIALIVIALATPISTSAWLAPLGDRATRDIVLVFDGSYSMAAVVQGQPTPWDDAIRQAHLHLDQASFGDRFAIVIARQPAHFVQADFTGNLAEVRASLDGMLMARGNSDMPGTLGAVWKHLRSRSQAATQQIVIFTDQQHYGWTDPATLAAFDSLGAQWHADIEQAKSDGAAIPSLRIVTVGGEQPREAPNYALAPIAASRSVAKLDQKIVFQTALHMQHFSKYEKPRTVNVLIDGQQTQTLVLPDASELKQGQIPLRFEHRFDKEGPHIVSVIVDAGPALDGLPTDNEQHAIVEVVKELPFLLVDGDRELSPESSSYFLQRAFASKSVTSVPYPALPIPDADKPAVIVLADVPRLEPSQIEAIDRFLAEGGGVWIIAGPRMLKEKQYANDAFYRAGKGWLPAPLEDIGASKDGVHPEPRTFQHPALELFRTASEGGMNQIRFSSWARVRPDPKDRTTVVAKFSNDEPFLLEKPYKKGRVVLSTVPMDRGWGSTLSGAYEFPILAHELAYYLAGSRSESARLQRGEPIRLVIDKNTPRITLQTPDIKTKTIDVQGETWTHENTGAIGVYQVQTPKRSWAFVVPPDLREANLARMSEDDWRRVRDRLPVTWQGAGATGANGDSADARREELWWLFLLAVLGLLCMEVWMTRRMALARGR